MGLIDDIKKQVSKSGANKGKFLYFKAGTKIRVRFLQDMDDGTKVLFHDSYAAGINVPCQETFDKKCSHCDDDELRHRDQYLWSVYDYEAKETRVLMGAVNNCSPVPLLVGFYDSYGTLTDRDYVITKNGQGTNATFSVVPQDKVKFRNEKAKPFSESKLLSLLDKAFPDEASEDDEDEEPVRKKSKGRKPVEEEDEEEEDEEPTPKKKGKKKPDPEPEEDEEEEEEPEDEYDDMPAIELYKLCKKKKLNVPVKKSEAFYIKKLREFDAEDEEEDEDEW